MKYRKLGARRDGLSTDGVFPSSCFYPTCVAASFAERCDNAFVGARIPGLSCHSMCKKPSRGTSAATARPFMKTIQTSDGTCRDHLLPQVVLVLSYRAIPGSDSLVLAHQDLLSNLVQQSGKYVISEESKEIGRASCRERV